MIVALSSDLKRPASRGYHVRPDLIGTLVKFDGDHLMIDFTRSEELVGRLVPMDGAKLSGAPVISRGDSVQDAQQAWVSRDAAPNSCPRALRNAFRLV